MQRRKRVAYARREQPYGGSFNKTVRAMQEKSMRFPDLVLCYQLRLRVFASTPFLLTPFAPEILHFKHFAKSPYVVTEITTILIA